MEPSDQGRPIEPVLCSARRTNGEPCSNRPMHGQTVCHAHGGRAPQARAAAARRLEEQRAAGELQRLGAGRRDIHPAEALLELVGRAAAEVDYWAAEVSGLDRGELVWSRSKHEEGYTGPGGVNVTTAEAQPHVAYRMLVDAQNRLASYSSAALKAGVDAAMVRLAERDGLRVAQAIRDILAGLHLTEEQQELVPVVVPAALSALAGEVS